MMVSERMYKKFRKEYTAIGDMQRADCFSYFDGYLEAMSDLEKLEYNDGFNTSFPTLADQEKYFDVLYWILQQMRGIAFDTEEAFSAESQKRGEDLPCKDLRVIASGKLGDPRDFEWVEEEEKP